MSFIIIKYFIVAVVLFLFFNFLRFLIPVIIKRNNNKKILLKYLPITELSFWLLFFIWVFQSFLSINQYFAIGILVVLISSLVWSSWYIFRDYIAGIMIKTDSEINIKETITISEITGRVVKFQFRTLKIETESGQIVNIPYTHILNEKVIKSDRTDTISGYTFELIVKKNDELRIIINKIEKTIMHLPWSSLKKNPVIKPIMENEKTYTLELTVYSLKKNFFYNIENYLKSNYQS